MNLIKAALISIVFSNFIFSCGVTNDKNSQVLSENTRALGEYVIWPTFGYGGRELSNEVGDTVKITQNDNGTVTLTSNKNEYLDYLTDETEFVGRTVWPPLPKGYLETWEYNPIIFLFYGRRLASGFHHIIQLQEGLNSSGETKLLLTVEQVAIARNRLGEVRNIPKKSHFILELPK